MKFNLSTTDATDPRGLLCGREANMRSSVFCICQNRCELMAKAWGSRPALNSIWCHEPAAATSHRYGRRPKTVVSEDVRQGVAPSIELGQLGQDGQDGQSEHPGLTHEKQELGQLA